MKPIFAEWRSPWIGKSNRLLPSPEDDVRLPAVSNSISFLWLLTKANNKKKITERDLMATNANSKSAQGERIFVTDKKREREQIIIKWKITKIKWGTTDKMREWPMAPFSSRPMLPITSKILLKFYTDTKKNSDPCSQRELAKKKIR